MRTGAPAPRTFRETVTGRPRLPPVNEGSNSPEKGRKGSARVGIIGLGYVGLPLAVAFAEAGVRVTGLDLDPVKVEMLSSGTSYIEDVPDEAIAAAAGRLEATTDYADLSGCEALIVCVPTPLTGSREPDLSFLEQAGQALAGVLVAGQTVILESTTYPGTTREMLAAELEKSGLKAGNDFHLAFSPERIDPGRTDYTIRTTPKLVGGIDPESTARAAEVYELVCDRVIRLSGPEVAELAKLLENIFRSVNIALVNELAQLCDRLGIDIWEVVDAAATKPFGFMKFEPGPGMGGHCLPVDPFYLAFRAREYDFYPEFIELAGKINQSQPLFCVNRAERVLNDAGKPVNGSKILLLGVSYKAGVGDTRESPAIKMIGLLETLGAEISYHDPHVPELRPDLRSVDLDPALEEADLTILVTAHPELDLEAVVSSSDLVLDLRGVTRHLEADNVTRL